MPTSPMPTTPMRELRTLSVFTENRVGLLHRVTAVFTRRNINIESLTVSESELPGIHRFTIVASLSRAEADKVALQLDKQVEVLKAIVHDAAEVIPRELALFKIEAPSREGEASLLSLLARHEARVIAREERFLVVEKAGPPEGIRALFDALTPLGVLEFVRSGSVALTRPMKKLSAFLAELDEARARASHQERGALEAP
jgi:acetolactate synthase-1/3 small subunit